MSWAVPPGKRSSLAESISLRSLESRSSPPATRSPRGLSIGMERSGGSGARIASSLTGILPSPPEETSPTGAMPVRRRRGGRERGFGGRAPESICFLRAAARGGRPDTSGGNSPTGAMPVRRRRGGREWGFAGKAPAPLFLGAAARGGRPDTSGGNKPNRSDAGPPASRRAGVGVRGQSPRAAVLRS